MRIRAGGDRPLDETKARPQTPPAWTHSWSLPTKSPRLLWSDEASRCSAETGRSLSASSRWCAVARHEYTLLVSGLVHSSSIWFRAGGNRAFLRPGLPPPFCRRPDLETSPQVTLSWGEDRGEHALERSGRLVGGPECSVSPREPFMQPGVFICELSYPLVGEFQTSAEGCAR